MRTKRYRQRSLIAIVVGWDLVCFVFVLAAAWGNTEPVSLERGRHLPIWGALLITGLDVACTGVYVWRFGRAGLYVSREGLRVVNPLSTVRIGWRDIEGVTVEREGRTSVIAVINRYGADPFGSGRFRRVMPAAERPSLTSSPRSTA